MRYRKPENIYVVQYLFVGHLNTDRWPVMKITRAITWTCGEATHIPRFIKRLRLVKIFTIRATYQSPIVLPSFDHVRIRGQSKTSPYGINLSALTLESNICIFRLQLLLSIV